jgi:hypothetical protein
VANVAARCSQAVESAARAAATRAIMARRTSSCVVTGASKPSRSALGPAGVVTCISKP